MQSILDDQNFVTFIHQMTYEGINDLSVTAQCMVNSSRDIATRVTLLPVNIRAVGFDSLDKYPFGLSAETAYRRRGHYLLPTNTLLEHVGSLYRSLNDVTVVKHNHHLRDV